MLDGAAVWAYAYLGVNRHRRGLRLLVHGLTRMPAGYVCWFTGLTRMPAGSTALLGWSTRSSGPRSG